MMPLVYSLVFILFSVYGNAYTMTMNMSPFKASMMKKVSGAVCASCIFVSSVAGIASPTLAAVGEGDLPPGAMAFQKLLKYQGDWDKLAESVKSREKEIDEKEVLSIKVFLKQLANEFYDMDLLSKTINDPIKQKEAKEIAKTFRLQIRECDDAAGKGNIAKVIENYPVTSKELKDFFGLMQDIPDEI